MWLGGVVRPLFRITNGFLIMLKSTENNSNGFQGSVNDEFADPAGVIPFQPNKVNTFRQVAKIGLNQIESFFDTQVFGIDLVAQYVQHHKPAIRFFGCAKGNPDKSVGRIGRE